MNRTNIFNKIFILIYSFIGYKDYGKPFDKLSDEKRKDYLKKISQHVVKYHLKDYSNIKFQDFNFAIIKEKGNRTYQIGSYVDIYDNSEIRIRNSYFVEIRVNNNYSINHNGYSYSIISCNIENDKSA